MKTIMSIKIAECQNCFENLFLDASGEVNFGVKPKRSVPQRVLSTGEILQFQNSIPIDLQEYFYKGIISLAEAFEGISSKHFSWATVKLYYATFYLLRASLLSKEICFLRAGRDLFYLKVKFSEFFCSTGDNTDHKSTIKTQKSLIGSADILLTNQIEGTDSYDWLIRKREEINYREVAFHEPSCPDCWAVLQSDISSLGLEHTIRKLLDDFSVYCFLADYAVLALPLQRLVFTKAEIMHSKYAFALSEQQMQGLLSYPLVSSSTYLLKLLCSFD